MLNFFKPTKITWIIFGSIILGSYVLGNFPTDSFAGRAFYLFAWPDFIVITLSSFFLEKSGATVFYKYLQSGQAYDFSLLGGVTFFILVVLFRYIYAVLLERIIKKIKMLNA